LQTLAFPCRLLFVLIGLLAVAGDGGTLVGRVSVQNPGGKLEYLEAGQVIVYLDKVSSEIPANIVNKNYTIRTVKKQFDPQLMVLPKGATVQFPNMDPIIHNVFSVSGGNRFDAGRYSKGEGKQHTFTNSGLVRIYCNVHHSMNALLYVADNPYYAVIDNNSEFRLEGLPAGKVEIVALHLRAGRERTIWVIEDGKTTKAQIILTLRKKRVKKHLNKFGKPYKTRRKRY